MSFIIILQILLPPLLLAIILTILIIRHNEPPQVMLTTALYYKPELFFSLENPDAEGYVDLILGPAGLGPVCCPGFDR